MGQTLRPTNYDPLNTLETTELSTDVAAAQKVANVLNSNGIVAEDFYIIGNRGAEGAELAKLDTKTGNALTAVANYGQAHRRGEQLTKVFGDKIKIYRATNVDGSVPADASFSAIATIDLDVDQQYTEYTDPTGSADYWYKRTYYNSVSTSETSLAASKAVRANDGGYYATPAEVREEAGLTNNRWIPESVYVEKLIAAQGEVNQSLRIGGYTLPLVSVPGMVKNATILLAAAYVLLKDYGPEHTGTNKEGNQKLEQGKLLLMKIEKSGLVDDTGENVAGSSNVNGYPDETADDLSPSEGFQFHITDEF